MSDKPKQWSTYRLSSEDSEEKSAPNQNAPDESSSEEQLTPSWQPDQVQPQPTQPDLESKPNILGMAVSAARSMSKFAATGFRRVAPETHAVRVAECHECQYRQGSQCTLCGCFADKKAWIPHEDCPIGRWPQ